MLKFPASTQFSKDQVDRLPKWNSDEFLLESARGPKFIKFLESVGVFFSSPLDLDFAMLQQFPDVYGVADNELKDPDNETIAAVLGKRHCNIGQYNEEEQQYFDAYYRRFKLGSKPAAHLEAMAQLDDITLNDMPESIDRLLEMVKSKLAELPE